MKIPIDTDTDTKFQMTPMIDMVFLLLVFFMCASHLSTMQNKELTVPTATKAVVPKERPSRFVINIDRGGGVFAGNAELDTESLKARVGELREAQPELKIYLRADQATPHRHVKKVMNAMAELGISDFIFAAFKTDEPLP